MIEQLSLFDTDPTLMTEPEVGEYVDKHGAVIPHIMRKSYIGRKVIINKSTESMPCFQCGILENYIPYCGDYRSIVFTGEKQRSLISHYIKGCEIYECLPWHAYEKRNRAIGKGTRK